MVRSSGAGILLALVPLVLLPKAGLAPELARGYWLEPVPSDDRESALVRTVTDPTLDAPRAAQSLADIASHNRGSTASGLAHLAAGMILVDHGHHAEAVAHLTDPDVAKTKLADYALRALGQAYEGAGEFQNAAQTYHALADRPDPNPLRCPALVRGAEVDNVVGRRDDAIGLLQRALSACPEQEAQALLQLGAVYEQRGELKNAAAALERVDRDHPDTAPGKEASARLKKLEPKLPPMAPRERIGHDLKKALVLFEAGDYAAAAQLFQSLLLRKPAEDEADLVRVRLGRALMATNRARQARTVLTQVTKGSAVEPEAAYHLAQLVSTPGHSSAYESVAKRFPGTPWAEEALLDLAHEQQKAGRDDDALPYYRRIYEGYPQGKYVDAATWRVAFGEYRHQRYEAAAALFEKAAQDRQSVLWRPAFLYWAGRARRELGQPDVARALFEQVVTRYKHAYHGLRAREALGLVAAGASTTHPAPPEGLPEVPEPWRTRTRNLLLIERLPEAMEELSTAPASPQVQATRAWIFSRQGRLRPAITAMKRAYPEYVTDAGDSLSDSVWRIMYPLEFQEALVSSSVQVGLDPALVAAVICQESTFDPQAMSAVGARGLMQLMLPTGRSLAHDIGVKRLDPNQLFDPGMGLTLGTRYLKDLVDRFGGKVERALAAYNAGPHRVGIWNLAHPGISSEEFVDSIPYQETRTYVMTILASQEQYRRIYALPPPTAAAANPEHRP